MGVFRYGDDFVALGTRSQTTKFQDELSQELIVKCRGVLSPRKDMRDCCEMVVLNGIERWVVGTTSERDRIEMDADGRHVTVLSQQLVF